MGGADRQEGRKTDRERFLNRIKRIKKDTVRRVPLDARLEGGQEDSPQDDHHADGGAEMALCGGEALTCLCG